MELAESSVSEEVAGVGEDREVGEGGCSEVLGLLHSHDAVHPVVLGLSEFGIEHQVGHGVVGVSQEVARDVPGAIVKILVAVALVPLQLVGVYEVVKEVDDAILEADHTPALRVHVEGELLESPDAQDLVVDAEEGIEQWSLLEISYGGLPIKHFF